MNTSSQLRQILQNIDRKGYKSYKQIGGSYRFGGFELHVDHVQGDPYAAPSRVRVGVAQAEANIPPGLFSNPIRKVAVEDYLARAVRQAIARFSRGNRGTGKSGRFTIDAGRQEVLERTAVVIDEDAVEARLHVGLPAAGRTILGREAIEMLLEELPLIVTHSLLWKNLSRDEAVAFVETVENHRAIQDRLEELGLVAFVANGSLLPRESGASDRPLAADRAVPFAACPPFETSIPVPNPLESGRGTITGLGIPKGITLIVGGGYHGKSTLLTALERGVYPHVPGDGREYVVALRDAVKIRAEDGRRVDGVDIGAFISDLPFDRGTRSFSSDDASGSTSQAANIVEAIEIGTRLLLLDEDTSATNFMVRDARMQALVHKDREPITPFLDRVRELHDTHAVSTILVMGGCGDYFDVADHVIMMSNYRPWDVSREAERVAAEMPTRRRRETAAPYAPPAERIVLAAGFDPSRGRRAVKIDAPAVDEIRFGRHNIDLRSVSQLVDPSQTRAIGHSIHLALSRFIDGRSTIRDVVDAVDAFFDQNGLDLLDPFYEPGRHPGDYARPRKHEIAAAINRLRTLRTKQE